MSMPIALLMGMAVGGALVAVSVRNILHAVFGLAIALLGIAGVFLYLNSPFVAAMEVIIYVGGISVAMVFAVMLSRALAVPQPTEGGGRVLRAVLGAGVFLALMGTVILKADFGTAPPLGETEAAWGVDRIGEALLTRYNLVFETLSVVLLLAIMGAIAVAQRPGKGAEEGR